jgi:hypothetical protein
VPLRKGPSRRTPIGRGRLDVTKSGSAGPGPDLVVLFRQRQGVEQFPDGDDLARNILGDGQANNLGGAGQIGERSEQSWIKSVVMAVSVPAWGAGIFQRPVQDQGVAALSSWVGLKISRQERPSITPGR